MPRNTQRSVYKVKISFEFDLGEEIDPYMFEEGAEIDPMIKERFMAAGKKSTTPKQLPMSDQNLNSLQQLQNQVSGVEKIRLCEPVCEQIRTGSLEFHKRHRNFLGRALLQVEQSGLSETHCRHCHEFLKEQ